MKLIATESKKVFLLGVWFFVSIADSQEPVITLPQGRITGIKVFSQNSLTPIEIFYGIPYALAPTGRYRFSAPERHPGWRRQFFAHRLPPRCPQEGDTEEDFISEDCLYLNVWTPRRADVNSLPVVVILYSESWSHGPAQSLPCEELAAEGVVVVTVSYRLHAFGFFMLKTLAARGNLALLDQYLALLWVRENVAAFGGDPLSITVMGHSAGADSILHHLASPRSVGLFKRVILMSPRDIWLSLNDDEGQKSQIEVEAASRELALDLGCDSNNHEDILRCLRSRNLRDFIKKSNLSNIFQPAPDNFLPESEQYLPLSVSESLRASRPPLQLQILVGTNSLDVINHRNYNQYAELGRQSKSLIMDYVTNRLIPELINLLSLDFADNSDMLKEAIVWEYWGGVSTGRAAEAAARARSAARGGAAAARLAGRLMRAGAALYVYRYDQPAGLDLHGTQPNFTGAVHGTDLVALLGGSLTLQVARRPATPAERQASIIFRRYVANFIKYGSPSSEEEWPQYRADASHVQAICSECDTESENKASRDVAFWLYYLPQLANMITTSRVAEKLPLEQGESRLRGGVFAMCGVTLVLLVLLCACGLLLRWERARRASDFDTQIN